MKKIVFASLILLSFFGPWFYPPIRNHASGIAIVAGILFSVFIGNPWLAKTAKMTGNLLGLAIVGMGFGMNLQKVLVAGMDGILLTVIGIALGLFLGTKLGKRFGVSNDSTWLISVGTAICGGSAIAAVAPVLKAKAHDVAISVAAIFVLNAAALLIFPPIGHALGLSQEAFGMWAALAIHDTSSVVGATFQYGPTALEIGTTVKLARALWIVPVAFLVSCVVARRERLALGDAAVKSKFKVKVPWFIPGFLLAAALVALLPATREAGSFIKELSQYLMVSTLFIIGANLSKDKLRELGVRPLLMALTLWITLSLIWGGAAFWGIL